MKPFDFEAPDSLGQALETLARHPGALALAGGTDLLVQLRSGRKTTGFVVDLKRIPELNKLQFDPASGLTLGAAVPCYRIADDASVRASYPALAEVAALIGGTQIQGRASIGGNLCNAAPSADAVPLLIALRAACRIAGPAGTREIPVESFCVAPGRNALQPGELLVSLHIPLPAPRSGARYLRFIPRNEMDIAVAGAGVSVELNGDNFGAVRIALASVAPKPLFVPQAGAFLAGRPLCHESIQTAAEMARDAASPISDMRGTAEYRRHLCAVLTRRAIHEAVRRAREAN